AEWLPQTFFDLRGSSPALQGGGADWDPSGWLFPAWSVPAPNCFASYTAFPEGKAHLDFPARVSWPRLYISAPPPASRPLEPACPCPMLPSPSEQARLCREPPLWRRNSRPFRDAHPPGTESQPQSRFPFALPCSPLPPR